MMTSLHELSPTAGGEEKAGGGEKGQRDSGWGLRYLSKLFARWRIFVRGGVVRSF